MTRRRGAVVVLLAAALLTVVQPASGVPIHHGHSSSLWHAPRSSLRATAADFDRRGVDIITWTEVRERADTLRRIPGWRSYAPSRSTDVAISWRRHAGWQLLARRTYWLAPRTTIAVVVLQRGAQRVLVTVGHLPSHVEYGDAFRVGVPAKVDAWQQAARLWRPTIRELRRRWDHPVIIVAADWNADVRRPAWRERVGAAFPGAQLTWKGPLPQRGTHRGGRLIDATLTTARGRARLLPRTVASDHRPYLEELKARASSK